MTRLSKESELLARNWDSVNDIVRGAQQLASELSKLLLSIEPDLARLDWWRPGWVFWQESVSEVVVANELWQANDAYAVWLGVEEFDPEHVFGAEPPPALYVWVLQAHEDLVAILSGEMAKLGHTPKPDGLYLVQQSVQKCLPEMVEEYPDLARKQIVEFIDQHARLLLDFDKTIKRYLSRKRSKKTN